ncbi:hypothetical protein EELLY_v1c03930 [Entomoplasma ellychniae]|uniref:tRNA-binding domain-containing protein n=1 Tax=Entomoplasma ellychniae TaxID=2114 RepID=A0A8E2UE38_9MOLU|nr:hypothetical protein [Entomoplasma ellychniae]PPE04713.1 hypothetical protein EELLY_v1c03930 [Entomoplasma ellychniae]
MIQKCGMFYNKQFNTLMVCMKNEKHNQIQTTKNLSILKKDGVIVGFNILDVEIKINKSFITSTDTEIIEFVNKKINLECKLTLNNQFVIGQIDYCESIPQTHLNACKVNIGEGLNLNVVCGASNAREGIFVIVCLPGSWLPDGKLIVNGKLRGYESNGMLCSAAELKLEGFNNNGIVELDSYYQNKVGFDFWRVNDEKN